MFLIVPDEVTLPKRWGLFAIRLRRENEMQRYTVLVSGHVEMYKYFVHQLRRVTSYVREIVQLTGGL